MKKYVILYVCLLHVFIAVLMVKTDFFVGVLSSLGYSQKNTNVIHYVNNMYSFQRQINLQIPSNQNFLIGDSIAKGLASINLNEPVINWGIGHNTTQSLLDNINSLDALFSAENVLINIGINDVNGNDAVNDIFARYKQIIQKLDKVQQVYVISVLPMGNQRPNSQVVNARVVKLNQQLLQLAKSTKHVVYVDVYQHLTQGEFLDPAFDRGDGLHINAIGYKRYTEILNKVVFNG